MAKVQAERIEINEEPERDTRFDDVEGRYAFIQTRGRVVGGGSVYQRAHIITATTNALTVTFYGRPPRKKGKHADQKPELMTELVKKVDIVQFRLLAG